ncbi:hypothetical protein [Aquimarina longa]|nr:hypothetical protein [Aquimarina longa]
MDRTTDHLCGFESRYPIGYGEIGRRTRLRFWQIWTHNPSFLKLINL